MRNQDEFEVRSLWISAYLLSMGCPLVRVVATEPRRSVFIHRNDNNRAFLLFQEWRDGTNAVVNGPAFVDAYRTVVHRARQAEDEDNYYRENSRGGNNNDEQRSA